LLSIHQELSHSILNSVRITKHLDKRERVKRDKTGKKRKAKTVMISFNNIGNRNAISFNNLTMTEAGLNNTCVCIQGDLEYDGFVICENNGKTTRWFNVSPPMLDWWSCVYNRFLSFSSQHSEIMRSNNRKIDESSFFLCHY